MDFIGLAWLFPFVMALAALVNGIGVKKLGKLAGYISVAAMASTFVLAVLIFLQVRGIVHEAPAPAHGEHGAAHAEGGHGKGSHAEQHAHPTLLGNWEHLSTDQKNQLALENLFVPANAAAPKPWDTKVREGQGGHVHLWRWIEVPQVLGSDRSLKVDMALHVDQLTSIFLLFISFVGSLVFLYATSYMIEHHGGHEVLDPGYARFFSYLALFAASMYTLILGSNFVVMFIGWEGVGLCSYLLIGYYFDRQFSAKLSCSDAGKKAFVANRVGDFGLMLGMFLLFWGLGTLDFQEIIGILSGGPVPSGFGYAGVFITAATMLLFLGATGKSAQIPLFVWLPDAMAGPTPVSALIHAATMVTAGIYMLARLNVLYMLSPMTLVIVAIIGAATAFIAAFVGLTQRGIKKILAYSTVSQLGYMFLAMGVGSFAAGIFHVFTHAFFKACLFLAAGSIIHALHHEEDVFKMGGLKSKMPMTWLAYLAATLAIAGIFPFAGFFSKDEILYMVYTAGQGGNHFYLFLWIIGLITAAFTAFYMGRSLVLAFHGKTRMETGHGHHHDHGHAHHDHDHGHDHDDSHDDNHGDHDSHGDEHAHHAVKFEDVKESPMSMTAVLILLGVCSALVGLLNIPSGLVHIDGFNNLFHHFISPVTDRGALFVASLAHGFTGVEAPYGALLVGNVLKDGALDVGFHGPELRLAIVSVIIGAAGLLLAFTIYGSGDLSKSRKIASLPLIGSLWNISWDGWKWDDAYDAVFVRGAMKFYQGVLWVDRFVVDAAVIGAGYTCDAISKGFRRLQNGQVQVYGLVMFVGVCVFLIYFTLGLAKFVDVAPTLVPKPVPAATAQISAPAPTQTALSTANH